MMNQDVDTLPKTTLPEFEENLSNMSTCSYLCYVFQVYTFDMYINSRLQYRKLLLPSLLSHVRILLGQFLGTKSGR